MGVALYSMFIAVRRKNYVLVAAGLLEGTRTCVRANAERVDTGSEHRLGDWFWFTAGETLQSSLPRARLTYTVDPQLPSTHEHNRAVNDASPCKLAHSHRS